MKNYFSNQFFKNITNGCLHDEKQMKLKYTTVKK